MFRRGNRHASAIRCRRSISADDPTCVPTGTNGCGTSPLRVGQIGPSHRSYAGHEVSYVQVCLVDYPGRIGSDGRPMIDLEELDRRGIELSPGQWDLFENGGDDYRLSQLDPIPGYVYQPPPDAGDAGHLLLDLLGLLPVAGEWADGLNCGWYAADGDSLNAGLSCAATVPFAGWGAAAAKAAQRGGKAMNLPSWKAIDIDVEHIVKNHTAQGKGYIESQRRGGHKDKFYDFMSADTIAHTVRQAYRNAQRVGPAQGDRIKMRGYANGMTIEIWVNIKTKTIETAYPQ